MIVYLAGGHYVRYKILEVFINTTKDLAKGTCALYRNRFLKYKEVVFIPFIQIICFDS